MVVAKAYNDDSFIEAFFKGSILKKIALKYFIAAFALVFAYTSVCCAMDAIIQTLAQVVSISHHHEVSEPCGHPTTGCHQGDAAAPSAHDQENDFCCSQTGGILVKTQNTEPLAKNLFLKAVLNDSDQAFNFSLFFVEISRLFDTAQPLGFHSTPFRVLNFPSHAPPSFLSC